MSSDASYAFVLLNGAMSPGAFVSAGLQVGTDSDDGSGQVSPQYSIAADREEVYGRLVWDADHRRNGAASSFFSVAPVRLHLKSSECLLAVGTGDFLRIPTAPYRWIERVQVGAITDTDASARAVAWDFIEVEFGYRDGRTETKRSNCLPRVATGAALRRSIQAEGGAPRRAPQQFTEILTHSREVVEIKLRGQVTLRANDASAGAVQPLLARDLQGRINVFTDSAAGVE